MRSSKASTKILQEGATERWRIEVRYVKTGAQDALLAKWNFRLGDGLWRAWFDDREAMLAAVTALRRAGLHGRALKVPEPRGSSPEAYVPSAAMKIPSLNENMGACTKPAPKPWVRYAVPEPTGLR